jgi:hypothetical protein
MRAGGALSVRRRANDFGAPSNHSTALPARSLLGHGHRARQEVDATNSKRGALAPSQTEHGADVHHGGIRLTHRLRQCRQLVGIEDMPTGQHRLGKLDASTWRPAQNLAVNGEVEDRSDRVVLATHRSR